MGRRAIKSTIDIEGLVQWTYQVQRANLIIGSGVGLYEGEAYVDGVGGMVRSGGESCARVKRARVVGCKVDGYGDLHPDSEVVHDAVIQATFKTCATSATAARRRSRTGAGDRGGSSLKRAGERRPGWP